MEPTVSLLGEGLRHLTPSSLACQIGCGTQCHHEQAFFKDENLEKSVIENLSSNWIIKNELLAISRPSESFLDKVILNFKKQNVKTIINLQQMGEHAFCGKLVDNNFTYKPETLMQNDITYYNFPTDDFGIWATG
jgi:protein tyrosine phosphatase domain-containing protein 1